MKKPFLIFFYILISVNFVFAAPVISNFSGTVSKGSKITLNGTGFASRTDFSPDNSNFLIRAWNNFENGSVLTDDWYHQFSGAYSENWSVVGNSNNRTGSTYFGARRYVNDQRGAISVNQNINANQWYASFYLNISDTCPTSGGQGKFMRIYGDNNNNIYFSPYASSNSIFSYFESIGGSQWGSPDGIKTNEWHRFELEMSKNPQYVKVYIDGKLQWKRNDWPSTSFNGSGHTWDIGNMVEAVRNTCYHRFDDIYLDHTIARVELCKSSSWTTTSSRACEIQIPHTWNNTNIGVTVNTGGFSSGQTAYLYVIDSNGAVNTNGYPVTIGASSDSGTPTTPPTGTAPPAPALNPPVVK